MTTGTYILELFDTDNTRQVSASYSVSTADTWEHKVITFPADTTGTIDDDDANSFTLTFWLAAGSAYSGGTLNTSWAANTSANRAVGQVNAVDDTANNITSQAFSLKLVKRPLLLTISHFQMSCLDVNDIVSSLEPQTRIQQIPAQYTVTVKRTLWF